jgi:nitrite reductase (NADH) small subunit
VRSYVVGNVSELQPGERKIVELEGRSIGVFNVDGDFYAIRNTCPHQGAPLCLGQLSGTAVASKPGEYEWGLEGRVIRCPWHGWEFDVTTGLSVFNPHRTRVKKYRVTVGAEAPEDPGVDAYHVSVEDDAVVVHLEG